MYTLFALLLLLVADRIDTVVGSGWVGDNGPATSAILLQAEGITADHGGNLYIADAADHRVRKVGPAGIISTIAGTGVTGFSGDGGPASAAQLNSPYGLAFDGRGNLYIADLGNARVRRVAPDGTIATIAGGGPIPAGGENEGSPATAVSFLAPRNLALSGDGSLYISDFSAQRVYRLSPDGFLTTAAGDGGPAPSVHLSYPAGLAVDGAGALYIADSQNHVVRKVQRGVNSIIARALTPTGLAFDRFGTLYIADPYSAQIVQVPTAGPATATGLGARDLAFSTDGNLYATDGSAVRRVSFSASSAIVAGGGSLAHGDSGPALEARLNHPSGVAADSAGSLYIADRDNHCIRRVSPDGIITTIAGGQLNSPSAVTVDPAGNLLIADTGNQRVLRITPAGVILPVASTGLVAPAYAVGAPDGTVYISDSVKGAIYRVSAKGAISTVLEGLQSPRGLALDSAGDLYFTEAAGQRVRRLAMSGDLVSLGAGLWSVPRGIAVSAKGDVFVADTGLQRIFRIDAAGAAVLIAGTGSAGFSGDGGPALAAELGFPWDVALGPGGELYIADLDNNRIRMLTPVPIVVVNAASQQPGPLAPGMLVSIRGADLGSDEAVLFNGIPAPILAADSSGLVVQAPARIGELQNVQVQILRNGILRAETALPVAPAAPALFADASGQALANNEDGTINSAANPAPRASVIVLYGTGEGVAGLPISVRIAETPMEVLYAGPVAGYPGLLQINVRVPGGYVAPGPMSVVLTVGQTSSPPGVTISTN